jgi:hypothetical protein
MDNAGKGSILDSSLRQGRLSAAPGHRDLPFSPNPKKRDRRSGLVFGLPRKRDLRSLFARPHFPRTEVSLGLPALRRRVARKKGTGSAARKRRGANARASSPTFPYKRVGRGCKGGSANRQHSASG